MQSDLLLTLHFLPTKTCLKHASILQISPMQYKANNTLLRGLRSKAIQPSGHVTTLPHVFRRLLGHPTHGLFAQCRKKIKLFVAQHDKTFCQPPGNILLSPCMQARSALPHASTLYRRPCRRPSRVPLRVNEVSVGGAMGDKEE